MNRRIRSMLPLAGILAAGVLSGCSSLQVGEEEFSCSGMPGSIYCNSARDIYEATNDGTVPSPMKKGEAYNEDCTDCVKSDLDGGPAIDRRGEASGGRASGAAGGSESAAADDAVIRSYVTPAIPERPVPIRTPSQVMRIWVAPFVDDNGDFNAPGYVYTEIEPRRWVLAKEATAGAQVFEPLEPKAAISEAAEGEGGEGFNSLEKLKREQRAKNAK